MIESVKKSPNQRNLVNWFKHFMGNFLIVVTIHFEWIVNSLFKKITQKTCTSRSPMQFGKKKRTTEARWCQGGPKRVQHARQMNAIGLKPNLSANIGEVVRKMNGERKLQPSPMKRQDNDLKQNHHDYVLQPWKSSGVYPDLPVPYVCFKQCPR